MNNNLPAYYNYQNDGYSGDERIIGRPLGFGRPFGYGRPYGFGRPFGYGGYGFPAGFAGGLLTGALLTPGYGYGYGGYPYPPYPYPYYGYY
ncbi:hypothetical protein E2R51_11120 [Jeotgalibacillus sp. S-D1]|uniref:hypothetical protein n=1 Tax=Jeotgalibacillus sp. S-D1 TaxID=2552189 RepID=UPI0010593294|nr:hypothetical protein [Jeotgalibacillus sp. S-D1]TDL31769.1 hypothetical protein E2R51_11120 [Jeotgalibacillus sp. S-D1]